MIAVFALARALMVTTELSMLVAAIAGAIAHGAWISARHIVDGAFTYFDVTLIFITATFFMNLLKHAGGVNFIIRRVRRLLQMACQAAAVDRSLLGARPHSRRSQRAESPI